MEHTNPPHEYTIRKPVKNPNPVEIDPELQSFIEKRDAAMVAFEEAFDALIAHDLLTLIFEGEPIATISRNGEDMTGSTVWAARDDLSIEKVFSADSSFPSYAVLHWYIEIYLLAHTRNISLEQAAQIVVGLLSSGRGVTVTFEDAPEA